VTAFVYTGVAAHPFWNSAIPAPRFLASAFCSGPAILLILFQILRRTTTIEVVAFLLFLFPATRRNLVTLNLGCLLIYIGVYIEKGIALVIPGMTPDTLGEFYEYVPTLSEVRVGAGIFAVGFLVFTLLCKIAIPILQKGTAPQVEALRS
jgi:Ni/Fe-hydrogenase subunit HybB-like protein